MTTNMQKTLVALAVGAMCTASGLGLTSVSADSLTWDATASTTGGSEGNGTWNTTNTNWYDTTTTTTEPVAWSNSASDSAYFGPGSGSYTVTLGANISAVTMAPGPTNNFAGTLTFDGTAANNYSITASGTVHFGGTGLNSDTATTGTFNLQNMTFNATGSKQGTGNDEVWGSTLNIGTTGGGATYNASDYLDIGGGSVSTVNVNNNSTLNVVNNIRIDGDNQWGNPSGSSTLNVNTGGKVDITSATGQLWLSNAHNRTAGGPDLGTVNVGGTLIASVITTQVNNGDPQIGTLNINSGGIVKTGQISSNTVTSAGVVANGKTIVNLNGGIIETSQVAAAAAGTTVVNFNGGTLQAVSPNSLGSWIQQAVTLNVNNGGAVLDANGNNGAMIYASLLQGSGGSTGGLTITNSGSTPGAVYLSKSVNTYTGPTEIQSNATLSLETNSTAPAATIADSSVLKIDSGGSLDISQNGLAQTVLNSLNDAGGTITFGMNGNQVSNILVNTASSISGTNTINVYGVYGATAFNYGTYNLIADAAGGLTGNFVFGNGTDSAHATLGSNSYLLTLSNSNTAEMLTVSPVPEPATLGLFAIGGMALVLIGRKRLRRTI